MRFLEKEFILKTPECDNQQVAIDPTPNRTSAPGRPTCSSSHGNDESIKKRAVSAVSSARGIGFKTIECYDMTNLDGLTLPLELLDYVYSQIDLSREWDYGQRDQSLPSHVWNTLEDWKNGVSKSQRES